MAQAFVNRGQTESAYSIGGITASTREVAAVVGDLAEPADADAAARAFAAGMLEELNRIEEAAIAQAVGAPASSFRGPYAAPPWGVSAFAGPVVHGNLVEAAVWPWDEPTPVNAALWRIWGE